MKGDASAPASPAAPAAFEEHVESESSFDSVLDRLLHARHFSASKLSPHLATLKELSKNALQSDIQQLKAKPLLRCLRFLLLRQDKMIRSKALRSIRYVLFNDNVAQDFVDLGLDVFLCRSLERTSRSSWERTQAMKLLNRLIEISPAFVQRSVVMTLIAIAGSPEDALRRSCVDVLRDLALVQTELVTSCNAIRTFVDVIMDSRCQEMASSLTLTLLYLLDGEETRRCIRPSLELQRLFSVYTNTDDLESQARDQEHKAAHNSLVMMMRSWTGILSLTSDRYGLRSLMQIISLPNSVSGGSWAKNCVFELIFDILEDLRAPGSQPSCGLDYQLGPNVLHNYIAMVLLSLIHCGVMEALTECGMNGSREDSAMATSLLSAILNLSSDLLPPSYNARLNSLSAIVSEASRFMEHKPVRRIRANAMLAQLQEYAESVDNASLGANDASISPSDLVQLTASDDNAIATFDLQQFALQNDFASGSVCRQFSLSNVFARSSLNLLEHDIHVLLKASLVLTTKEFRSWNLKRLVALCGESPSAAIGSLHKTKFIKRFMNVLKPSKQIFSELSWNLENMPIVRVCCSLLRLLVSCPEGNEDPHLVELLTELIDSLKDEISRCGNDSFAASGESVLCLRRVLRGTSRAYLFFLGIASSSVHWNKVFLRRGFYEALFNLADKPKKDYLARVIACHLDYSLDSNESKSRDLLAFWLTNGSIRLRKFLVQHLRILMRRRVQGFHEWGIALLCSQMAVDDEVAFDALNVLDEACFDEMNLHATIHMKPCFAVVGAAADPLLTKFLSTADGLEFASALGWVDEQLLVWKESGAECYVEQLENALVAAMNDDAIPSRFASHHPDANQYFMRLHDLPWQANVSILHGDGRKSQLPSDSLVEVTPAGSGDIVLSVAVHILSSWGIALSAPISPDAQLNVKLSIGCEALKAHVHPKFVERVCTSASRMSIRADELVFVDEHVRWKFEYRSDEKGNTQLCLRCIYFHIPLPDNPASAVCLAPHLYGTLARSEEGCLLLRATRHLHEFISVVHNPSAPSTKRRAALWTLGLVASSPTGFELLSEFNGFVEFLAEQVVSCGTLSMRGTCFYILGLISLTQPGRAKLSTLGWESPLNTSLGISLPANVSTLFNVSSSTNTRPKAASRRGVPDETMAAMQHETPIVILRHISSLVNNITQKSSYAALQRLRLSDPDMFRSASLFRAAFELLCRYSFKLSIRRFVLFELFSDVVLEGSECFETALDNNNSCSPAELCARVFDDVERHQRPRVLDCRKQPTKPYLPTPRSK